MNLSPETPLLNYIESTRLKEQGMQAAAYSYGANEWLERARAVAEMLAATQGDCSIDDVLKACPRPEGVSPGATGSVFKGKKFRRVGYTTTRQVKGHARAISLWSLA